MRTSSGRGRQAQRSSKNPRIRSTVIAAMVPKIQKDIGGISRRRSLNVRNRKRYEKPLRRRSFYAMKYRQAEIKRAVISEVADKWKVPMAALWPANGYTTARAAMQSQRREGSKYASCSCPSGARKRPRIYSRVFRCLEGTDEDKILACYSDDVVIHLPTRTLKGRQTCQITSSGRSLPRSLAMYMRFGTWPTPKIWSRRNGVLTLCTKAILAKSWLRAKRFRFLVVPSTSTTLDPERFRQEGSTSILLPSCGKLARERKSPGRLTRHHATSLIQHGTRPAANLPRNRGEKF